VSRSLRCASATRLSAEFGAQMKVWRSRELFDKDAISGDVTKTRDLLNSSINVVDSQFDVFPIPVYLRFRSRLGRG
jgi:hypothetical protein